MMIIVTLLHCHIVTYDYQVCANILENAKEVFQSKIEQAKKVIRGKSPGQVWEKYLSTDLEIWKCNWHQNIFWHMQQCFKPPGAASFETFLVLNVELASDREEELCHQVGARAAQHGSHSRQQGRQTGKSFSGEK